MRRIHSWVIVFLVLPALAAAQPVNIDHLKSEILLKLLSQNRNFDFQSDDTVSIAIIFNAGDTSSQARAAIYERILAEHRHSPFRRNKMRIVSRAHTDLPAAGWGKLHAALLMPGTLINLGELLEACAASQALSMSTDSLMVKLGVSIAVEVNDDLQPEIWFNANSLSRENGAYDARILQLVKNVVWE